MYHTACSTLNNAPSGTDGKTGEPGVKQDGTILKLKLCYILSLLSCSTLMLEGRGIAWWLSSRLMVRSLVQSLAEVARGFFCPESTLCADSYSQFHTKYQFQTSTLVLLQQHVKPKDPSAKGARGRWENFLVQSHSLTLISVSIPNFHPSVTAAACKTNSNTAKLKDPGYCAKSACGRLQLCIHEQAYTLKV